MTPPRSSALNARSTSGFTATAPPSSPTPAHRPVATEVRPTFLAPLLRPGLRAAGRNDRTQSPPFFCLWSWSLHRARFLAGLDPTALQSPSCSHLTMAKSTPTTCSTKCRENKAELLSIFHLYMTATHLTHNVFVESPKQRQQTIGEPSVLPCCSYLSALCQRGVTRFGCLLRAAAQARRRLSCCVEGTAVKPRTAPPRSRTSQRPRRRPCSASYSALPPPSSSPSPPSCCHVQKRR
jgi:hypothetical protein